MAVMAMCVLLSCTEKKEEATLSGLMKSDFVSEVQGKPTALYVLKNQNGAEACVTNWGGRLVSVMVPDKNGKMTDVVLGYDNIQQYVDNPNNNYGGLIGRYGNRRYVLNCHPGRPIRSRSSLHVPASILHLYRLEETKVIHI